MKNYRFILKVQQGKVAHDIRSLRTLVPSQIVKCPRARSIVAGRPAVVNIRYQLVVTGGSRQRGLFVVGTVGLHDWSRLFDSWRFILKEEVYNQLCSV